MVDYFGDPVLARDLAGHPDEVDVTPDEIISGLKFGHQQLFLFTGKTDWDITTVSEVIAEQLKRIEEHFCGSWVKSWWRDPDKTSQTLWNRAIAMCNQLKEVQSISGTTLNSFTSTTYNYRTNALNSAVPRYKSPRVDV